MPTPTYLVDGTTPLPYNGQTAWGPVLNTALEEIDGRFTYSSPNYGLASNVVSSSLTSVGTLTSLAVSGAVTIGGNLTVNGTTTTINSTTITTDDIILTLGGDTAPGSDDNKDRGVAFRWHNGSAAKLGFFGYDDSTGKFTFIPDATDTSDVYSGTLGTIDVGAVHVNGAQIAASNLSNGTTGSGSIVLATSPTLSSPSLGAATATSVNKVAITAPTTSATLTIADGGTLATTGANSITLASTGATSVTLPTAGTLATTAGSESLTNKKLGSLTTNGLVTTSGGDGTLSVTSLGSNVATFLSTPTSSNLASAITDETGSAGSVVFSSYPTIGAPRISSARVPWTVDSSTTSGSVSIHVATAQHVYFSSYATGNFTFDIVGNGYITLNDHFGSAGVGYGLEVLVSIVINNGATPYYPTGFSIDGSAVAPAWVGAAPSSGTANSFDMYNLRILKTAANTWIVFARRETFA